MNQLLSNHRVRAGAVLFIQTATWAIAGIAALAAGFPCGTAVAADRIIDQLPFDQLTLKEGKATYKLIPLEMAKRRPLTRGDTDSALVVRLLDRPEQRYQVKWKDILRVELFEELVLREASALVDSGKFDEAYEYFALLIKRVPEFPGLSEARQQCMFREAQQWQQDDGFENALALLTELYDQKKDFPGLSEAMGQAVDSLVAKHLALRQNAAARKLVVGLESRFPGHAVAARHRQRLIDLAEEAYTTALRAADAGRLRDAHDAVETALGIWPDLEIARQLAAELNARYPIVRVGVRAVTRVVALPYPRTWSSLRQDRLVQRRLFEPVAFGAEGGRYESPLGTFKEEGLQLVFQTSSKIHWPVLDRTISPFDVVGGLLAAAQPGSRCRLSVWRDSLGSITPVERGAVELLWRNRPPFWQALLDVSPAAWERPLRGSFATGGLGPYRAVAGSGGRQPYVLCANYFAVGGDQPREVIEQQYGNTMAAIRALREQRILAFDRIAPWERDVVRNHDDLQLVEYAAPTVHFLLPNPRSRLMASGVVRRAIAAAVDRAHILKDVLGVETSDHGQILTGPFPRGYAFDKTVVQRRFEPRATIALLQDALGLHRSGDSKVSITLVHPPSVTARRAAAAIEQQLELDGMGMQVHLREATWDALLSGAASSVGSASADAEPWDLYYFEWCMMEPLIDARTLLGRDGLCERADAEIDDALKQLAHVDNLGDATDYLHAIHRRVHESLAVIPLWQLKEYGVVHRALQGVGEQPVTLYQNIEQWKVTRGR